MSYIVKSFTLKCDSGDTLRLCSTVTNVNNKYLLLTKGNNETYLPNVWSEVVCKDFKLSPRSYIKKHWGDLSNLGYLGVNCSKETSIFLKTLSPEQRFVVDNNFKHNPKSGISFVAIDLLPHGLSYSLLGDVFLFIYDVKQNKLRAYCSMIDNHGRFDFSQPCHSFYNDLTLLGNVLSGEKTLKEGDVALIMTKDLANWFIQNSSSSLTESIKSLISIQDENEFKKNIKRIYTKQTYKGIPFDKDTTACITIQYICSNKFESYKNKLLCLIKGHKVILVLFAILMCLVLLLKMCSHSLVDADKSSDKNKIEQIKK